MLPVASVVAALSFATPVLTAEPANLATVVSAKLAAADWPWWRGPNRNGVAFPDQSPPLRWSESEHVVWRASIPGKGHGSPIVVGDQVNRDAAWYYPDPKPAAANVKDHVAFWHGVTVEG